MDFKLCLGLTVVSIVYLLLGGAIFEALEHSHERQLAVAIEAAFQDFIGNNSCVSEKELRTLTVTLSEASDAGVQLSNASTPTDYNWDFGSSVFFCFTVISTIGYGNVAPSTEGGQVMFIFYAMFGIPLMLTLLAKYGLWISQVNKKLADKLRFYNNPKFDTAFDGGLLYVLGLIVCVFIPGALFNVIEEWTYMESVYYAVTTISTVGFGDYVPQPVASEGFLHFLYPFSVGMWCIIGLTWFAGLISTLQGRLESNMKKPEESSEKESAQN